jgi:molybdate transport system regulatory protein
MVRICDISGRDPAALWRYVVRLSTRNQLAGTVTAINQGAVMATVKVDLSGQEVTAAITREAVEDLGLSVGDPVTVLVKSTEVMLAVAD